VTWINVEDKKKDVPLLLLNMDYVQTEVKFYDKHRNYEGSNSSELWAKVIA
jgi:hypothetical protein